MTQHHEESEAEYAAFDQIGEMMEETRGVVEKTKRYMRPVDLRKGDICRAYLVLEDPKTKDGVVSVFVQYTADGGVETRQWDVNRATQDHCVEYLGKLQLIGMEDATPQQLWQAYNLK